MASGAVFKALMEMSYVSKGEGEQLSTLRKVETAQRALNTAAGKSSSTQKQAAAATKATATAAKSQESATKAVTSATERAENSSRQAAEATERNTSASRALDSTLAQLAAARERESREAMDAASAARKAAQAADLSTKEGRDLAKQLNQVALSHDRAAKSSEQAAAALRKQDQSADAASTSSKRLDRSQRDLAGSLKRAVRYAVMMAGAYIGLSQAKAAIETTNELALASMGLRTNLGLTIKEASRWTAVAKMRGVDNKALTLSFTTLSRRIEDAAAGTESALQPFRAMGITQKQLKATQGDFQAQLMLLADAFGKTEGSTKRQAAAQKLLGRGYQALLPMFVAGAKGLKEQFHWADKAGATFGDKLAKKQMELATSQRKSKLAILGLQVAFARFATPAVIRANEELQTFITTLNDPKLAADEKMKRISRQLEKLVGDIADRIPQVIERAIPTAAASAGRLSAAILKGLVAGFAHGSPLAKLFTMAGIIRLVGGRGALLAAGRTLGGMLATGAGQGMAAGAAAGGAGGGIGAGLAGAAGGAAASKGILGRMGGLAKGAGRLGGIGLALTAGLEVADEMVNNSADNAMARLEQIDSQGRGLRGSLYRMVGPLNMSFTDSNGTVATLGDRAHRLKQILEEINGVGRARAGQLRAEGQELLNNLDLTRQERDAINATLNAPQRATHQNKADSGIADLRSGVITRSQDIQKVVARTQAHIDAGWARGSDGWRKKTAQAMNAQVRAIRAGMDRSLIATSKGQAKIQQILRDRKLLTGNDPVGIARGFAKSWKRTHEITPRELKRINRDLAKMPKDAREKAIASMEAMAQGLNRRGKLPQRELDKLTSSLRARFGKTGKGAFDGLSKGATAAFDSLKKIVPSIFRDVKTKAAAGYRELGRASADGARASRKPIKGLASDVGRYAGRIRRAITEVPGPMRTAFIRMGDYANTASEGFGSSERVTLNFRRGGVSRYAAGGLIPARVSSGELLRYPDGSWSTVPGGRVARDNILTALPAATEVYTDSGQALLGMGASRSEALDMQLPHFAAGGKVPHPRLAGGSKVGRGVGQAGIDRVHKAAKKWVDKQEANAEGVGSLDGQQVANWIIPILKWARGNGWGGSVSSGFRSLAEQTRLWNNRASNPYPVAPPGTSNHEGSKYPRGAVDVTDYGSLIPLVDDRRGPAPGKLKWFGPGDKIHFSGSGHRKGGIVSFRGGGSMSAYQVAATAKRAKWPKNLLWLVTAISGGESSWNPRTHNTNGEDSRGLMQINVEPGANPQYASKDLFNPLVNMRVAKRVWKDNGRSFNPWSVYTSGRYHDFAAQARAAVKRLREHGDTSTGGGSTFKKVTKVTDDLKGMSAKTARRSMPRLLSGHDRGAFMAAMDAGRLTRATRRNAVTRALVKVKKSTHRVKTGGGSGRGADTKAKTIRRMQGFGDRISRKNMPYQYGGGHAKLGKGNPSFDCSGYVSGVLGAGGFINSPMVVAQGTGLYTLGKAGRGRNITWGVRGSSGQNAHTMIRVGDRYYESGSGHGPKRVSGWSGAFQKRHIKGWRTGTGSSGVRGGRPRKPLTARRLLNDPRFGTGAYAAQVIDGIGSGTGRQISRLFRAGNRDNAQVKKALGKLGRQLSHVGRFSVSRLEQLQESVKRTIKRTIDPNSPGGRKITKAEAALIRRSRSVLDLTQAAMGAKAGLHLKQSKRIATRAEQRRFERGLKLRRAGVDPSSSAGLMFEGESTKIQIAADRKRRHQLNQALEIARKAGDRKAITKIRGQLREVNNAIAEGIVSLLEKAREAIAARVEEARTATERRLTHVSLWDRAAAAAQKLKGATDSPEAMLAQADQATATISVFERQRDQAAAAAAVFAKRGMKKEAQEAIDQWHEAVVAIAEATADQVELRRNAALVAAQRSTDRAAGNSAIESIMYERFQLEQKLAGTFDSGAAGRRDFILAQIVPALTAELTAMESQLQVVIANADEETVRQQKQGVEQKRNELMQAQLEAQEQIAENTDPRAIGGALAFQFGGETLTDQLILAGNGI